MSYLFKASAASVKLSVSGEDCMLECYANFDLFLLFGLCFTESSTISFALLRVFYLEAILLSHPTPSHFFASPSSEDTFLPRNNPLKSINCVSESAVSLPRVPSKVRSGAPVDRAFLFFLCLQPKRASAMVSSALNLIYSDKTIYCPGSSSGCAMRSIATEPVSL